mmetsp:Transcript_20354/g.51564  ORF Transcript_20354/g.51564 Transcript_20354/m.51564 type:complete len:338 (-) Transcript_20354:82-1095(-)
MVFMSACIPAAAACMQDGPQPAPAFRSCWCMLLLFAACCLQPSRCRPVLPAGCLDGGAQRPGQLLHSCQALLGRLGLPQRPDQRRATDDALRAPRLDLRRVLGPRHAKPDRHGLVRDGVQHADQALHARLHVLLDARHTRDRHQVDEALAGLRNLLHAGLWRGGRGEQHQLQPVLLAVPAHLGRLLQRDVGHQQALGTRLADGLAEAVHAAADDGVVVGEHHQRRLHAGRHATHHLNHLLQGGTLLQGTGGSSLNDGPVSQGVRVRHAQLNDIGTDGIQLLQCSLSGGQVGIASTNEGDEGHLLVLLQLGHSARHTLGSDCCSLANSGAATSSSHTG